MARRRSEEEGHGVVPWILIPTWSEEVCIMIEILFDMFADPLIGILIIIAFIGTIFGIGYMLYGAKKAKNDPTRTLKKDSIYVVLLFLSCIIGVFVALSL
jgi:hypothetical protein